MSSQSSSPAHVNWLWQDLNWVWGLVVAAWLSLGASFSSHSMHGMHHASTFISEFSSWNLMVVAMMLPTVLPLSRAFNLIIHDFADRFWHQLIFISAYLLLWSIFSLAAVVLFEFLPSTVQSTGFRGASLVAVGMFQFSPLKQTCLKGCRHASLAIAQYYQPGIWGTWQLGIRHGLYCLGCCWALMLEMGVLGVHSLILMLAFTAIMLVERFWKHGEMAAAGIGIGLMLWGTATLLLS